MTKKELLKELKKHSLTKQELVKFLVDNFTNEYGNLDLRGLDFSNFDGNVYLNNMKVKRDLYLNGQEVGESLHQDNQKVGGDLVQSYQEVGGSLLQNHQEVGGRLQQDNKEVNKC